MSESGGNYYEVLQGRLRAILGVVADQLPRFTVDLVTEFIDANECGLALETLTEMLHESSAQLTRQLAAEMHSLADEMGLDRQVGDRLIPLVKEPEREA
ncbi:MAG: MafI family immunity protein [Propionicimonas sp.]